MRVCWRSLCHIMFFTSDLSHVVSFNLKRKCICKSFSRTISVIPLIRLPSSSMPPETPSFIPHQSSQYIQNIPNTNPKHLCKAGGGSQATCGRGTAQIVETGRTTNVKGKVERIRAHSTVFCVCSPWRPLYVCTSARPLRVVALPNNTIIACHCLQCVVRVLYTKIYTQSLCTLPLYIYIYILLRQQTTNAPHNSHFDWSQIFMYICFKSSFSVLFQFPIHWFFVVVFFLNE